MPRKSAMFWKVRAIPRRAASVRLHARRVSPSKVSSRLGLVDAADHVEQRALAGAVGTDERADLPGATSKPTSLIARTPRNDSEISSSRRCGGGVGDERRGELGAGSGRARGLAAREQAGDGPVDRRLERAGASIAQAADEAVRLRASRIIARTDRRAASVERPRAAPHGRCRSRRCSERRASFGVPGRGSSARCRPASVAEHPGEAGADRRALASSFTDTRARDVAPSRAQHWPRSPGPSPSLSGERELEPGSSHGDAGS